jgi:hypothetical protein
VTQDEEYWPSIHQTLGTISSTTKKRKRQTGRQQAGRQELSVTGTEQEKMRNGIGYVSSIWRAYLACPRLWI